MIPHVDGGLSVGVAPGLPTRTKWAIAGLGPGLLDFNGGDEALRLAGDDDLTVVESAMKALGGMYGRGFAQGPVTRFVAT